MNRSVSQLNLQQPEKDRCFEDRNTLTPQEMKVLSLELAEDQHGVIPASVAWANTTDSVVRPVEAEGLRRYKTEPSLNVNSRLSSEYQRWRTIN